MIRVHSKKCSNAKNISIKETDRRVAKSLKISYSSQDNSFMEDFKRNKLGKKYNVKDGNVHSLKSDNLIHLTRFISNIRRAEQIRKYGIQTKKNLPSDVVRLSDEL